MKKNLSLFSIFLILLSGYTLIQHTFADKNELIMVAFGDSITHGSGDSFKKGYIERFKEKFEAEKNIPVHLSNYAISKYTTEDVLEQLEDEQKVQKIKTANYIFLFIGTNDFRKSAKYEFTPLNVNKINQGKKKFSANLNEILETIHNHNSIAPIFVLGLYHPYEEYKNHQEIYNQIELWNQEIWNRTQSFNQIVFVPTIDLFKEQPKIHYFNDSIHPNTSGHDLIAERLLTFMSK